MAITRGRTTSRSSSTRKPERTGLGGGSVDQHLSTPKRKRAGRWAQIGDGNTIQARVVDPVEFFADGQVHAVPFERKDGSTYTMDRRCLDPQDQGEPCPGCKDDLERRYKFWMLVIWRDAPKENKAGKIIGNEDQVKILSGANRLVKQLNAKQKRRDLNKRDIEISQDGEKFEVQYEVEWVTDEDVPLSSADKKLLKSPAAVDVIEAYKAYTEIPEFEDFYEAPGFADNDDDEDDDRAASSKRRGSVFDKERNKVKGSSARRRPAQDEDDEDDEDERPKTKFKTRTTTSSAKPKGIAAVRKSQSGSKPSSSGGKTIKRRISR